jgi:hypothetical protein
VTENHTPLLPVISTELFKSTVTKGILLDDDDDDPDDDDDDDESGRVDSYRR